MADVIKVGMRIEIKSDDNNDELAGDATFVSEVFDIFPNGDIEIAMPIYKNRLILLQNGARYSFMFCETKVFYEAKGIVKDRYKSDNQYLLKIRLLTQPTKIQRREYYRCETSFEVDLQDMTVEEGTSDQIQKILIDYDINSRREDLMHGLAVDISGGGIRIMTRFISDNLSYKRIIFDLPLENKMQHFNLCGQVLSCIAIKDSVSRYENRFKFVGITPEDRERIIKFIFEEERKIRKITRGNEE